MGKAAVRAGLWVGCCVIVWCGTAVAEAAPTPAAMLAFRPHQPGVNYTTPAASEQDSCKVELISGNHPGTSGYLLRDAKGIPLRRFYDANGTGKVDTYCYYLDGVEVYRELASNGKVEQYRWLNSGGMKWGVDTDHDGKVDFWRMISAEEVSQEILQAVITRDFARLQALWITDADIKALEMPPAEVSRIQALREQAQAKFQATLAKVGPLDAQTHWERLESAGPQCVLAEHSGYKRDVLKYPRSMILYQAGGKHDWIQAGEMIQVGAAWRLVDVPVPGTMDSNSSAPEDPALQALLDEVRQLDAQAPKGQDAQGPNPALADYNRKRADLIERVLAKVKPDEREQWLHQLADCLAAAAQNSAAGNTSAYDRLVKLEEQTAQAQPGSPAAAYVTFREMQADYAPKLTKVSGAEFTKVQEQWVTRLAKFVADYPKADDTPDALLQLGMVTEFLGKEAEAKKWYQLLASNFPDKKAFADKAQGALRRMDLEGKPFELSASTLDGRPYNIGQSRGRVVVVYYWASWSPACVGDFARLKLMLNTYGAKGLDLVCVNLDNAPPLAGTSQDTPGIQLVQAGTPGGLDGPLATQYGIPVTPYMVLVGRDGKVVNRNLQTATLEDELKKLFK